MLYFLINIMYKSISICIYGRGGGLAGSALPPGGAPAGVGRIGAKGGVMVVEALGPACCWGTVV